jgi:potassium efflux system protein
MACVLCFSSAAQEPGAIVEPSTSRSDDVSVASVQLLIKQTEELADLDASVKGQVLSLYNQAIDELKSAEDWLRKAEESEQYKRTAPATLEIIQEQLSKSTQEPEVPSTAPLSQLEASLIEIEEELLAVQKEYTQLEEEPTRRGRRRVEMIDMSAAAKKRVEEVNKRLAAISEPEEPPPVTAAKRVLFKAQTRNAEREIEAYERELLSYEARSDLLRLRRDLAARQLSEQQKKAAVWREAVNRRRQFESTKQASEARLAETRSHPAVRDLAETNTSLAERRSALSTLIERATRERVAMGDKLSELKAKHKSVVEREEVAGLTKVLGILLRKHRAELPSLREHRRNARLRQQEISKVELDILELEQQRSALADIDQEVLRVLAEPEAEIAELAKDEILLEVRGLLETRKTYMEDLIRDSNKHFDALVNLDFTERELIQEVGAAADYITQRVLWIRSTSALRIGDIADSAASVRWLLDAPNWSGFVRILWADAQRNLILLLVAGLILVMPLVQRPLRHRLERLGENVRSDYAGTLAQTTFAVFVTGLLAGSWPVVMWVVAWRSSAAIDASEFSASVARALLAAGFVFLTIDLVRQTCREKGLAELHFRWALRDLHKAYHLLCRSMTAILPLVFLFALLDSQSDETLGNSLGKISFITAMLIFAFTVHKLWGFGTGVERKVARGDPEKRSSRFRHILRPATAGIPIALAALAIGGYYFTAIQLALRLIGTMLLAETVLLFYALVMRWLWVARWRLAVREAGKRQGADAEGTDAGNVVLGAEISDFKSIEEHVDIPALSGQTRQLVLFIAAFVMVVGLWLIWVDVLPALAVLRDVTLVETPSITLADVMLASMVAIMTLVAARNVPALMEIMILQRLPLGAGERYAMATLFRYLLVVTGVAVVCGVIGIKWSSVQWLVAAMTVGLGFGLQEIVGNFVSGLIILFERPIRVGDKVTMGDVSGTVTKIRMRATTVTDFNRKELIVPNKDFVTGQLINWTLSDRILRLVIPVGIAYGSDTELARDLLLKVARENPNVLGDPAPSTHFLAFGDSSLQLELWVFVPGLEELIEARDGLHSSIAKTFRAAGIEIAFPQRDIHVRSIRQALPIVEKSQEE